MSTAGKFTILNPPRDPTAEERREMEERFPNIGNFKVIGEKDEAFNCLGWAIGHRADLRAAEYMTHLDQFRCGLEPVSKEQAQIDVYYDSLNRVSHVSRFQSGNWTSKMGTEGLLIIHDREAISGFRYGTVQKHWGQKGRASASSASAAKFAAPVHNKLSASLATEPEPVTEEEISAVREFAIKAVTIPKKGTPKAPPNTIPKTTLPKTTLPKTTLPKTTLPKTTLPTTTPNTTQPKPTIPPQGSPKFEAAYTSWKATWKSPELKFSSWDVDYTLSSAYKSLIALGATILPQLAAKLTVAGNKYAAIPYVELDKTWRTKHPKPLSTTEIKASIIKDSAATNKRIAAGVKAFAFHKDNIISAGLKGAAIAAQLMTDPLFMAIVREGGAAAVHILQVQAQDKSHHSAIWGEMLRQIHTIEQHGTGVEAQKEFKDWLDSYLSHSTAPAPEDGGSSEGEIAPPVEGGIPVEEVPPVQASDVAEEAQ